MTQQLTFVLTARRTPLAEKALEILKREVRERAGVETVEAPEGADIVLDVCPGIGAEGFRIEGGPGEPVRIVGNDDRGLLYGIGKFLRTSRFADGAFEPGAWRGESVPQKPVRAMYFATHYHNFYHDAPLDDVARYVEEMALWGCNVLQVWFDMHAYTGIGDPAAQRMIARLHAILRAANSVGMEASLTSLANEAYHTSPKHLRAEPFPHHYHVEICPSKPEGLALILKWREEALRAFADLDIGYFWIGAYDQGGCRCAACKPWGASGYLRNAEAVAALVHHQWPRAKVVLVTWEFGYWEGEAEWDAFYAAMAKRPEWVGCVMAEHHGDYPKYVIDHGRPGGFPLLNFPEISMFGMWPWGGFGANPMPSRLQQLWNQCGTLVCGGAPYSEGIYEDINKAIAWQLYWDGRPPLETVREYAAYEFAPEAADDVAAAVQALEANQEHSVDLDAAKRWATGSSGEETVLYRLPRVEEPERASRLLRDAEGAMSARARAGWRWRVLRARADLDEELHRSGGRATPRSEDLFRELSRTYHAERATPAVAPPRGEALRRAVGGH
jgi:hypothetical protein